MDNLIKKSPEYMQLIFKTKPMLRLVGILSTTLILGISFTFISQGIVFGLLRLSPYFWSAYRPVAFLAGVEYSHEEYQPIEIKWFHLISIIVGVLPSLLLVGAGIWFLIDGGFCAQNLFCWLWGS